MSDGCFQMPVEPDAATDDDYPGDDYFYPESEYLDDDASIVNAHVLADGKTILYFVRCGGREYVQEDILI